MLEVYQLRTLRLLMEEPDAINPTEKERSAGPPRFQKSVLPTNFAVAKGSGLRLIYFRRGPGGGKL